MSTTCEEPEAAEATATDAAGSGYATATDAVEAAGAADTAAATCATGSEAEVSASVHDAIAHSAATDGSAHNPGDDSAATDDVDAGGGGVEVHRIVRFARAVDAAFDRLGDAAAWSMTEPEQAEALQLLDTLGSRLTELKLRVLAPAERQRLGAEVGATSTAAWLAQQTRQTRARCHADVRLATDLDESFSATRAALAAGRINPDQAKVIVEAVGALTREHDHLPPDTETRAEAHLLGLADQFDAAVLRRLGKRLFEVVCPEAADQAEGEALDREEQRARRTATLRMRDNGDGTVDGWFRLPTLHAQLLTKTVETLTAPRRLGDGRFDPTTGRPLPSQVLAGQALLELLEHHLNPQHLPNTGGSPFTLVITMSLDTLTSGIGAATLETGHRISAGQARRLACRAGIIPMVLDGDSMPLDLGREQRLFDRYQRLAHAHTHGGCATHGCDRPPAWVETHHKQRWSHGGRTDLADGIPLCPPHHHMADHPQHWDMRTLPSGKVRFTRRQ